MTRIPGSWPVNHNLSKDEPCDSPHPMGMLGNSPLESRLIEAHWTPMIGATEY